MNQTEPKLTDVERMNVTSAIDFLVPYVHSIVKISSEVDLPIDDFKKEIINLYFRINSEDSSLTSDPLTLSTSIGEGI